MAHWLFWQKNTIGAALTAAMFIASLASPSLAAPSPKYVTTTVSLPSRCTPRAYPVACSSWAARTSV